ncbi:AH receptor-interacting protein [Neocloeon triangulifer]|uniref:AH receptor-interacting protein n=1 Tax=Neocloeon triangulifer TaxID=2078957 RepID=UPI00286EEB8D|nr:AH receptor-interacting protein [Neocloeon triangulifer]
MDLSLIQKKILYAGKEFRPIKAGTKVHFHFVTKRCDDQTVLDDSRKMGKPMELILGKKFKLEVWEAIIQQMSLNEVAQFTVDKSLVASYPFVSKTLRDSYKPKEHRNHHCCGVSLQTEGIGYDDLNFLMKEPCDLEYTMELLSVEDDYKKETWQLSENEKVDLVPQLKEEGNELYRKGLNKEAADKYSEALAILEHLMLKEKPGDEEWNVLNAQKLPLLLNFSQCRLNQGEFYTVIEHCTTVLEKEPENVKALYRRGKAHIGAWNPAEARKDLQRAAELQPSLAQAISVDLKSLEEEERKRDAEDKARFAGKMF